MSKKKSKLAFPLGMLIIIFAVVGLVAAVRFGVSTVKTLTNESKKKTEYEEFLRPVVMYDPDPFDDVSSADIPQLVNASIWSLITKSSSSEAFSYSTGENMGILIPQDKVTEEFNRLFGKEVDIENQYTSIDMSSHDITYDAAQGGFIIPITGLEVAYTPEVYEIEKKASSIILTVGYIGSKAWAEIENNEYVSPQPDKYMKITLRKGDDGYYIASLQSIGAQEVANAETTVPVSVTNNANILTTDAENGTVTLPNESKPDDGKAEKDDKKDGESEETSTGKPEETTTAA